MHEDKDQQINTEPFFFSLKKKKREEKGGRMLSYIDCTRGLGNNFNGNLQPEVGAGKRNMENGVFTFV